MNPDGLRERIDRIMRDFVGIYSPTGTAKERSVESFYGEWFKSVEYFRSHADQAGFFEIPGDCLGRVIPWCLLKGSGDGAVVLLHHYDVVDTGDYKALSDLATKPNEIMDAFRAGKIELDEESSRDLESGDWIFGRGTADMKGGAAIQMALVERYAALSACGDLRGNIVLIGLPDEENLSSGGRAAPLLLKKLKDQYGLKYLLAFNAEPTDRVLGENRPKIHVSSIGKVMPLIFARGTLSHAGMVYEGLNPIRIMSEVVGKLDLNASFIEKDGLVSSPASTFLFLKDRKNIYDVSLPMYASGYMNVMFINNSVEWIMKFIREKCAEAFSSAIADVQKSCDAYTGVSGHARRQLPWRVNVKFYSELYADADRDSGGKSKAGLAGVISELRQRITAGEISLVEASHVVIEKTLSYVTDISPVIVIALIPPYYPYAASAMLGEGADKANEVCDGVIERAKEKYGDEHVRHCMVGMSDLSYFIQRPHSADNDYIKENMLLWKDIYDIPFDEIAEVSMPVLNIGPWGKDIHKYTERVFSPDLYARTPDLISFAVDKILSF
ncbi:MAG: M20/M25/M40 family metallo-hydrolase [Synergistaceae bacterium]|jgi:arginine utilization protein RocB|nr:M20/M25/M40 family metallo-hydrolase [Synergistaceae bacterium]